MLFGGTREENLVLSRPKDTAFTTNARTQDGQAQGLLLRTLAQASLEASVVKSLLYAVLSTRLAYQALDRGMGHSSKAARDYFYATTHQFGAQYAPMALVAGKLAHNASHEFEGLQQPTLIICGAHTMNKARSIKNQQHLSAHNRMVLLQDAGINVHEERPDEVVANILEWSEKGTTDALKQEQAAPSVPEAVTSTEAGPGIEAYCIKCKKKTRVQNSHEVTTKTGRIAIQGTCPVCGTNIYRMGKFAKGSENT